MAALLLTYPGIPVRLVGYTDSQGPDAANAELSLARATATHDYLVSQGVAPSDMLVEGRGEVAASGSTDLAGLERRVKLKVAPLTAPISGPLRMAIVAPSAGNGLSFTESMVAAARVLGTERNGFELTVADNAFVVDDAAAAAGGLAAEGYNLIALHDPQLGEVVSSLAEQHPTWCSPGARLTRRRRRPTSTPDRPAASRGATSSAP